MNENPINIDPRKETKDSFYTNINNKILNIFTLIYSNDMEYTTYGTRI